MDHMVLLLLVCFLASDFDSLRMPECSYFWQIPVVKLIFLRNYKLDLFHQDLYSNFWKYGGVWVLGNCQSGFCIKFIVGQKRQNNL